MSVQALSKAISIRGVSASEKLMLMVLANYADERMRSFPSHKRLAEDACLSERTVLSVLRSLEASGLIIRAERKRPDGSRSTDLITLCIGGETISPHGEIAAPGVGKPLRQGGEMVAPLTTFEPSINQERSEDLSHKTRASKRCPAEWLPKVETVQTLANEGYQPGELERALNMVRDHQFPRLISDWDAAYRNWVRRDRPRPAGKTNVQHQPDQRQAARLDNYRAAFAGAEQASRNRAFSG